MVPLGIKVSARQQTGSVYLLSLLSTQVRSDQDPSWCLTSVVLPDQQTKMMRTVLMVSLMLALLLATVQSAVMR